MLRRQFISKSALLGASLGWQAFLPVWAQSNQQSRHIHSLQGNDIDLSISEQRSSVAGKRAKHIRINDQFPAPLLRWQQGDALKIRVHNGLDESTSIHWHGILLPWQMDGVPGVSFPGIAAGESFEYQFKLQQAGTYWYHSHSGLQEQLGHYGPIIIDPTTPEPYQWDREYVVMLSDWTFENPQRVFSKLKKMSDTYNFRQRTIADFFSDVQSEGLDATLSERMMWGDMRMNRTDLADVSAATYTYLINGHSPADNWQGLFQEGERIRLRFINASAMSIFNVRIPGLSMTVVQCDGQDVQAVDTDEFQIGTAETFDVIVKPQGDRAYSIMAETSDFSGYASATLSPKAGMLAQVPALRPRPLLSMKDMGMDTSAMKGPMNTEPMAGVHHNTMSASMEHGMSEHNHTMGPGVVGIAMNPISRLHERPIGLEKEAHRVLVYTDLRSLNRNPDTRSPERHLYLHLTSNMERYMWSFDGIKFSEVSGPIPLYMGERARLTFVNDTMMPHPVHLHGMFFDVVKDESAEDEFKPHKHTLVIKPAEKVSIDISVDAPGPWVFHCHLLYHMHAGMMRVFFADTKERLT